MPAGYRDTDPSKLPLPNLTQELVQWCASSVEAGFGLATLTGATGSGKTRSLFLAGREAALRGCGVATYINGEEMADEAWLRSMPPDKGGIGGWHEWLANLKNCKVLFIDEAEKFNFTPRSKIALFSVIEYRIAHRVPITILAGNIRPAELAKRMTKPDEKSKQKGPDLTYGPALLRRLHEFGRHFDFSKPTTHNPTPSSKKAKS
jgi:DNA replication protein DnaC